MRDPGSFAARPSSASLQAGERVHLAGHEQVERRVGALRRHELGALEIAAQEQLVVGAGRGGDADAVAIDVRRGAQRRGARHEVRRLDLEIRRGEAHQRLARRIGAEERDVPHAGRRRVAHDGDAVVRDDLDGHAEPPADLLHQVDRHAARLAGRPVLRGENEVAVVDPGAELAGRGEVGADGGRDVGHGCTWNGMPNRSATRVRFCTVPAGSGMPLRSVHR